MGDTRAATGVGLLRESSALRGNLRPLRIYTGDLTPPYQRLELENDLIAAHVLEHGAPPSAQFLG
jgi:hypothetical protein